jgi:heme-degrading monooxygenase HmoA
MTRLGAKNYEFAQKEKFLLREDRTFLKLVSHATWPGCVKMIAVIFEVEPTEGRKDEYLDIAADMRPMLDQVDGFISVERFQSLTDPRKVLSLSFFEDEAAIARWRTLNAHRGAQARGRAGVFTDYIRLRIASVVRDYGMFDRAQAPTDSKKAHAE